MNDLLPQLIAEVSAVGDEAQKRFGLLSPRQLNWKPSWTRSRSSSRTSDGTWRRQDV